MTVRPHSAMVLAAGLGTRMRPLTDRTAKPLLPLRGKALIDHALDRLNEAEVKSVVVNAFWQAERVQRHIAARTAPPHCIVRTETSLLDTGGGVQAALPLLGEEPFYVVNGDAFWVDGPTPALQRLAAAFDDTVDGVLLVHRTVQVLGEVGAGDFAIDPMGVPRRRAERQIAPYLYAGVQLIAPALLRGSFSALPHVSSAPLPGVSSESAFSMNEAWDRAMAAGRLRAVVHDGLWFHLSTPDDLAEAEEFLRVRWTGDARLPWN